MKETELKLGDLVAYKDKVGKVSVYVPPVLYVDAEGESISTILADSDLQPIPLTEEILEKNGWKKVRISPFYTAYFEYKFVHEEKPTFYKKMQDTAIYHDFFERAQIPFVHQLQHILWALGLDDDLKIQGLCIN